MKPYNVPYAVLLPRPVEAVGGTYIGRHRQPGCVRASVGQIDDISVDDIVDEAKRCICVAFPDYPCDNEWDGIDEMCSECRPRCRWAEATGRDPGRFCCGNTATCMLLPLIGTELKVHVRQPYWFR